MVEVSLWMVGITVDQWIPTQVLCMDGGVVYKQAHSARDSRDRCARQPMWNRWATGIRDGLSQLSRTVQQGYVRRGNG